MTFPTLFTVGVHTYTEGMQLDDYGDPEPIFTPAKDQPGTLTSVYGWSSPQSTEPFTAGHDRVIVDLQLWVPPDFPATAYDLIDVPDMGQFQMVGEPQDWNHGPFAFTPGKVANLRKVAG